MEHSMRGRRGTLGACRAEVQGEDGDRPPRSLRTRESPRRSGAPSWAKKPAVDLRGNPHGEMVSSAVRSDRSEASLLPHGDAPVRPCAKGSVRRGCASPVAQSETADLFFAPAEERGAGGSCGVQGALVRDWPAGGPRATESRGGRCRSGEPRGSGLRCCEKPSEMGASEDEPSAFPEARGSESEPSCLHSVLSPPPRASPHVFSSDGTERAPPGRAEPTEERGKTPPRLRGAAGALPVTPGLQAARAFPVAKPLRHS